MQVANHALTLANKANGLQNDVTSLRNELREFKAFVTKNLNTTPVVPAAPTVDYNKVADVVWAKLWDALYLIRVAMNSGNSADSNTQGFLVDLTSFIKRVGK
jgi:hypothetical protein